MLPLRFQELATKCPCVCGGERIREPSVCGVCKSVQTLDEGRGQSPNQDACNGPVPPLSLQETPSLSLMTDAVSSIWLFLTTGLADESNEEAVVQQLKDVTKRLGCRAGCCPMLAKEI